MVIYFSTTGNTRYVAEEIGKRLDDTVIDVKERIKNHDYSPIHSEKPIVICSPVYVSELPRIYTAFIRKTPFTGNKHIYFVFTSGGYIGISSEIARMLAAKKGLKYMGSAEIDMVQNYIATKYFKTPNKEEVEEKLTAAFSKITPKADTINSLETLKSRHVWFLEFLITLPVNPIWCHTMQSTKGFYATDKCIGCGKCSNLCPLGGITLDDNNRPSWADRQCAHCMSCIQNCPTDAIEYRNLTQGKLRYNFDKYRYLVK